MSDDGTIGGLGVRVFPNADRFFTDLTARLDPEARRVGNNLGNLIGAGIARGTRDAIRRGLGEDPRPEAEIMAGKFARTFKARLEAAMRDLPKAKIDADSSPADRKMAELRASLKTLADSKIGIDITEKEAKAKIKEITAELDKLGKKSPDIRVRVDTNAAKAELKLLEEELFKVGTKQAGNAAGTGPSTGLLIGGAIVAGLSLVGPAAGAATAALAGVVGIGGTALLAFKGIQTEMKSGSAVGHAFQTEVDGIGHSISALEGIAAKSIRGGVYSSLSQVKAFMPTLNPMVAQLGKHLGNALSIGTGGLISGLKVMAPLINDAGGYAETLATKFAHAAQSPEFRQFVAYARSELPIVGKVLGDIGSAAIHLGTALQPYGDDLLQIIDRTSQAITLTSKLIEATQQGGKKNGDASDIFNFQGRYNSSKAKADKGFLDYVNIALGAGDVFAGKKKDLKSQTAAMDESTRAANFNALALQNAARAVGSTSPAYEAARSAAQAQAAQTKATTLEYVLENNAVGLLNQSLQKLGGNNLGVASATTAVHSATLGVVTALHDNGRTLDENSAKGLANRQALESQASAAMGLRQAIAQQTGSTVQANSALAAQKASLEASLRAHGALTPAVQAYINTLYKVPATRATKIDLDKAAAAAGVSSIKSALNGIPVVKTVSVRVLADRSIQTVKERISSMYGQPVYQTIVVTQRTNGTVSVHSGPKATFASGGFVRGPGTGTSDSINAKLSDGEFVSTAKATAANRQALEAANQGARLVAVPKFAAGGYYYNGIGYTTELARQNAMVRAQQGAARKAASAQKAASSKAAAAAKAAAKVAARASAKFNSARTAVRDTAIPLVQRAERFNISALPSATTKLISTAKSSGVIGSGLSHTLAVENNRLATETAKRKTIVSKLTAANAALSNIQKTYSEEAKKVADAVRGSFDISTAGASDNGIGSPDRIIASLKQNVQDAQAFKTELAKLKTLGLNKTLYAQLAEGGPNSANAIGLRNASQSQIATINSLYSTLNTTANVLVTLSLTRSMELASMQLRD